MTSEDSTRRSAVEPFIARYSEETAIQAVRDFLDDDVLVLDGADSSSYEGGAIWAGGVNRSLGRKSHAWFFLRYWYSTWSTLDPKTKAVLAGKTREMFTNWCAHNEDAEMAYHDETTAQRTINFVVFLDTVRDEIDPGLAIEITDFIEQEVALLSSDRFFAGLNNHGMFQDVAILVAIAYGFMGERAAALEDASLARLASYFAECFGKDGIHNENNPSYHLMVARYLSHVLNYCTLTGFSDRVAKLKDIFNHADRYGAFALTPRNHFVPISDTKKGPVALSNVIEAFDRGEMAAVLTRGEQGELPQTRTFVTEESGYAVYRSDWTEDANYLFFSAAYNADYHKHSDEMSLYYYANGRELIAEAGPNGYQYSDPLTKFAFSSAAHNTLLVDGEGLPRVDKNSHKTRLEDLRSDSSSLHVIGRTGRFRGVDWSREIDVPAEANGELVRIADTVESNEEHAFTFLWHLGEDLVPVVRGNALEVFDPVSDVKLCELTWSGSASVGVRHIRGQRHPHHQGWIFPKMGSVKKNSAVEVEFRGRSLEIEWELRSHNFRLKGHGAAPKSKWRTHFAEKPVNFLLEGVPEDGKVGELAIIFEAVMERFDYENNYLGSMAKFPGATLYILDDFGEHGSYYLASHRNLAEFRSVQSLIRTVVDGVGVPYKNVIALGSAKGGAAAILHGATLGVGHVYVSTPDYRIGNQSRDMHPEILDYISGGQTEADVSWSNDSVCKILSSGVRSTGLSILVGREDRHFSNHTVPLVNDLKALGYAPEHLVLHGVVRSGTTAVSRMFLDSIVLSKSSDEYILPHAVAYDPQTLTLSVVISGCKGNRVRAQLFNGRNKVGGLVSVQQGKAKWRVDEEGRYRARVYVDDSRYPERQAFGTIPIRI